MKLTPNQIKEIAAGVARVEEREGKIFLLRFTEAQESVYAKRESKDFYNKTFATAGVRLAFTTDSRSLSLTTQTLPASSRQFFTYSVYRNDVFLGSHGGDTCVESITGNYDLGEGEKKVEIFFPWAVSSPILALSLDDGASVTPYKRAHKMIMFGDSITHGYDSKDPAHSYASLLAKAMDADAINKGIGGEVFRPSLARRSDEIHVDYITVAYGSNDWTKKDYDTFCQNSTAFYEAISARHPNAKIFAITPIWRGDFDRETACGRFDRIDEHLTKVAASLPNVTVLHGFDFVPHDPSYFSPDVLHPNDEGFAKYFENLYRAIHPYL